MTMRILALPLAAALVSFNAVASEPHAAVAHGTHGGEHRQVSAAAIVEQRTRLAKSTFDKGFGPQSPRDIDSPAGENSIVFGPAPSATKMNLCNIHFHKNAEHRGGEFRKHAGNGDGHGYLGGYQYSGYLSEAERSPLDHETCPSPHGSLYPGDTIEVHYVYSSALVKPGPTLKSCLSDAIRNPQLRVEAQVYVLVNDSEALDFAQLTRYGRQNGFYQALGIPKHTGSPVQYAGSTTGPGYNEVGSPFQVAWSVRPQVAKVNIATVGQWCKGNVFEEDHAHGVRNLVTNPALLSRLLHE